MERQNITLVIVLVAVVAALAACVRYSYGAMPVAPPLMATVPVAPPVEEGDEAPSSLPKDGARDGEWTFRRDPRHPRGGYWFRLHYVLRSVSAGGVRQNCVT